MAVVMTRMGRKKLDMYQCNTKPGVGTRKFLPIVINIASEHVRDAIFYERAQGVRGERRRSCLLLIPHSGTPAITSLDRLGTCR